MESSEKLPFLQDAQAGKGEALSEILGQYEAVGSWSARSGTALALQSCAPCFDADDVSQCMNFLMGRGVVDPDEEVRSRMLDAGALPATPQSGTLSCYCLARLNGRGLFNSSIAMLTSK